MCKKMSSFFNLPQRGQTRNVAVKVFLSEIEGLVERSTIAELLEISKKPKHLLYAYKEIRQEVAFLSVLEHPNLTELCGVRTSPYMSLLLELAPKKSLREMLKEYKECNLVLEPLTLKNTTWQVRRLWGVLRLYVAGFGSTLASIKSV